MVFSTPDLTLVRIVSSQGTSRFASRYLGQDLRLSGWGEPEAAAPGQHNSSHSSDAMCYRDNNPSAPRQQIWSMGPSGIPACFEEHKDSTWTTGLPKLGDIPDGQPTDDLGPRCTEVPPLATGAGHRWH